MPELTQKEWLKQRAKLLRQVIIDGDRSHDERDCFDKVLDLFEPTEYLKEKSEWKT